MEGSTQVVNPVIRNFPGYEVTAAVVNCDIDMVVPRRAVTFEKVLSSLFSRNTWRILIAHESYAGGRFYDWPSIVRGYPRVTVGVRIETYRGFNGVINPKDRRVRKYVVFRKDIFDVSVIAAPTCPSFKDPR
jgi:hypothetical protein